MRIFLPLVLICGPSAFFSLLLLVATCDMMITLEDDSGEYLPPNVLRNRTLSSPLPSRNYLTEPLDISRDRIKQRLWNKVITDNLREWDMVPLSYFQDIKVFRSSLGINMLVTDDRPRLEFYLLMTLQQGGKKLSACNFWSEKRSRAIRQVKRLSTSTH